MSDTAATGSIEKVEERLPKKRWRVIQYSESDDIPIKRSGASSVVYRDALYVFGGYGGQGRLDDMYKFNFNTKAWQRVAGSPSTTPSGASCAAGGTSESIVVNKTAFALTEAKALPKWKGPGGRENNGAVVWKDGMYLFGGYSGYMWLNDFYRFDFGSETWTELETTGTKPSTRFGYVTGVYETGGLFFVFGGYDGCSWLNDMHEYSFDQNMWTCTKQIGQAPSGRSCPTWGTYQDAVYVFGGYDGVQRMNDFHRFEFSTRYWTAVTCCGPVPSPRYFHASVVYGDCMYVFGGYNGQERLNDLYQYSFDKHEWSVLEAECRPGSRSSLVAQVYKDSLFVFGGYNGQIVLNDFYELKFEVISIPPPSLIDDLRALINNKTLSDVTLMVDGKPIYVNRAHMAVRSDHFRALFYGGMKETHQPLGEPVVIPDISYEMFMAILIFLYTDELASDIGWETAVQLLIAAERFCLDRLKALCEDICRRSIRVDNVVELLLAANAHRAEGLKTMCLEFVTEHEELMAQADVMRHLLQEPAVLYEVYMRSVTHHARNLSLGD